MHARGVALRIAAFVFVTLSLCVPSILSAADAPATAARTIILIRHGAYVSDPKNESPGPGLSPLGIAQAKLVAARLAGMPGTFDALRASPMTRAHETAKVIAAELPGVSLEIIPELAECTPSTRRKEIIANESRRTWRRVPRSSTRCSRGGSSPSEGTSAARSWSATAT